MSYNNNIPLDIRRYKTNSKSLNDSDRITINIQTDFLDHCAFNCDGCFVKRRNTFTENDLIILNDLSEKLSENDYELNEIILGPTDLFGARNTFEILNNPNFIKLFDSFSALTFNSTLMSDPKYITDIYKVIQDNYLSKSYLELFVILDIDRFVSKDQLYLDLLEENLETLKEANIIFIYNIHNKGMFDRIDFPKLSSEINTRFNSHLKMNPSFFRSHKIPLILDNLYSWRDTIENIYLDENREKILFNMIDSNFGGFTYFTYLFKNGKMYVTPYIYDFIFDNNDGMVIPRNKFLDVDRIFDFESQLTKKQYEYSKETEDCDDCEFLTSCVSKRVLSFMENHGIKQCFLPRKLMSTY